MKKFIEFLRSIFTEQKPVHDLTVPAEHVETVEEETSFIEVQHDNGIRSYKPIKVKETKTPVVEEKPVDPETLVEKPAKKRAPRKKKTKEVAE